MGTRNKGGLIGGFDQLRAPDAPTISVTAGSSQVSVAFTNPSDTGGGDISSYTATAIASGVSTGATSATSPVTITGLSNGTSYSVTGLANNAFGASPYSSATSASPSAGPDRGVFIGGISSTGSYPNDVTMDFVQISSTGNASDFGDYGQRVAYIATASSTTRGLGAGGRLDASGYLNVIEYITLASAANGTDFGDLQQAKQRVGGGSNTTRAVFYGGLNSSSSILNEIDTVTIASTGNATDYNDMATARYSHGTFSSSTRGISCGGYNSSSSLINEIEFSVFASSGSATDFGDLTQSVALTTGLSSATRGVRTGGQTSGGKTQTMDYVTMASGGNATNFGNLLYGSPQSGTNQAGATSNATRGIIGGGDTGANRDVIQYITIASQGVATDFGDLTVARKATEGLSGSHGGLQ